MFKRHLLPWGLRALLLGIVLLWSHPATAAVTYQQIKSFGPSPDQTGENPASSLIEDNDGVLYGTTVGGGSAGNGTVFKVNKDGTGYTALHSFNPAIGSGSVVYANLAEGTDGVLYGTTTLNDGSASKGTIFRLSKDGTGYSILHSFGSVVGDGWNPAASLIEGNDGVLYGTAANGGSAGSLGGLGGTVFKVNKDGTGYAILHNFGSIDFDALNPVASLTEGSDGALYGTTRFGGSASEGALFKINKDGTGYAVLHSFRSVVSDGYRPLAGLIEGNDGALYGTTSVDGDGDSTKGGTVFKVNKDGGGYAILYRFSRTGGDGAYPQASLTEGNDGALHGMTYKGGSAGKGTLFKVNKDGTGYAVLRSFGGSVGDGHSPYANLTIGNNGVLYGMTQSGGNAERGTIFKVNEDGTGYAIVRSFITPGNEGRNPYASMIEGNDGVLYGTTHQSASEGLGTIFKMNKDGTGYAILHSFSTSGGSGYFPYASLTEGNDGKLYGTTYQGGSAGEGTVFKMNKDGTGYAVLRSFTNADGDGQGPYASLTEGNDGKLYGTTAYGGSAGAGTIYTLNKDGTGYAVLRSFLTIGGDGKYPYASLTEGNDGALYGTTYQGGNVSGFGTVFKMNKDGTGYGVLHTFGNNVDNDGRNPWASLTEGNNGVLYGTTLNGGGPAGMGTVFAMNKDGTGYAILHSFIGNSFSIPSGDGSRPRAGLIEGNDGALYGTTQQGGIASDDSVGLGRGTVYKVNKDGTGYAVLRRFSATGGDGRNPDASLTKGNDGALYGTTVNGGQLNYGTIFRISNNLPPTAPVQTFVRTSGLDLKIKNEDLLAACSDPEGGAVTLQSLGNSAQGATITQTATHILYTPVNGDNDQFTYTVSDAQGVTSTGTIQVQVVSPGGIVQSVTSNGGVLVANFAGIPGFNYEIQRATSPGGPWTTLVTQPAPANGLFSYTDPSPLSPSAFYRLIQP